MKAVFAAVGVCLVSVLNIGAQTTCQFTTTVPINETCSSVGIGTATPSYLLEVGDHLPSDITAMVTNTDTGATSFASIGAKNAAPTANAFRLLAMGTAWASAGAFIQNAGVLQAAANLSGGISILTSNAAGAIRFYTGGQNERVRIDPLGKVGIGTAIPSEALQVAGAVKVTGATSTVTTNSASLDYLAMTGGRIVAFGPNTTTPATFQIVLKSSDGSVPGPAPRLFIDPLGNVGIGNTTGTLSSLLTVAGAVQVDTNIHANGVISGGMVIANYQDVAEWVPSGQRLLPRTVVTIDTGKKNEVLPSSHAYDTSVAGVVSEKPGVLLGIEGATKSQIATTGRVLVHADATRHPILAGDLLVTGQKPGTAMYSEPVDLGGVKIHRPGTILGKALEPLTSGEGDILVLLSLQ